MPKTLVIEIPDELEQQLSTQAQVLQTSLENVVLRSLSQSLNFALPSTAQAQSSQIEVIEMLLRIQTAADAGNSTVEVQATPATIYVADVMQQRQLIADVQQAQDQAQHCLLIQIPPSQQLSKTCAELLEQCRSTKENAVGEPALAAIFSPIVEDLQSTDASIRLKAVEKLKGLGRQSA
ncbi:hypothetical protein [Acaryochloris sp. IP29b_bin.148]|uniref:hypothetical protein n=1 Tax=Acaryochloris sp. IP29b_bin.148 TaxID=2969218 RepID=UPI00260630F2|nr:hypothetical protein [Acaryochloris sp. IP29b_bin.148]